MFDNIDVSVSSIAFDTFEYLKILSNFCKLVELKFVNVVKTFDLIVSAVLIVEFVSNLTTEVNNIFVVSGSTISGVTEATLNFFNCVTKSNLVVILSPDGYDPSTVILESVIFEKPVVNLVLDEKFFNFSYEIHNAVISITEKDDIQQIIHKILNDKNFKSELLSNGKNFLDGYMKNHKNASKYLAQKILDLNENN